MPVRHRQRPRTIAAPSRPSATTRAKTESGWRCKFCGGKFLDDMSRERHAIMSPGCGGFSGPAVAKVQAKLISK